MEKRRTQKQASDGYGRSRLLYIIEAALEYFIAIAVGTVYLARITAEIGISDSLTGILCSFVSLGCGFQIVAIFLANRRPVKPWVTWVHMISQTLFALLYLVPLFSFSSAAKAVVFVILLLSAHILHNIIQSPKINWYMSLVDDRRRGRFTANKEIVSLIGGMVFSFLLGMLIDHYSATGEVRKSFVLCGILLFALMILHSLTLIFSKEKPAPPEKTPTGKIVKELFKDKTLFKLLLVSALWNMANYATFSFTGTYQAKELAFSSTFSSVVIMAGSLIRAIFSQPMGRFADRFSFSKMLFVCFGIEAVAFGINVFTSPSNGKVFYAIFYILYCIGMAGINNAMINLVYDYVDHERRTGALALNYSLSGITGFLTTLALSPLVGMIQKNGNTFLGISVYAQQVLSAISLLVVLAALVYLLTVVRKIPKKISSAEKYPQEPADGASPNASADQELR